MRVLSLNWNYGAPLGKVDYSFLITARTNFHYGFFSGDTPLFGARVFVLARAKLTSG